jgi:hypothetical protein
MPKKRLFKTAFIGDRSVEVAIKVKREMWFLYPVVIKYQSNWYILEDVVNTDESIANYVQLNWDSFELLFHKYNPNKKYFIATAR